MNQVDLFIGGLRVSLAAEVKGQVDSSRHGNYSDLTRFEDAGGVSMGMWTLRNVTG